MMLNINDLTPRALQIILLCAFSNLRVLHDNKTPKWQSIKLMIHRPKQSNPHTNAVNMKSYNWADTYARKTTTYWLFHPPSLFAVKSSSCLLVASCLSLQIYVQFFFFNSSHFFLSGSWTFCFRFLFHSLSVLSSFFDIIRGKVLCSATCYLFFFFEVVKSLVKQKESGRLRCHPFERMEGRQTERQISRALIGLSSIRRQTQNILLYASWMA